MPELHCIACGAEMADTNADHDAGWCPDCNTIRAAYEPFDRLDREYERELMTRFNEGRL